MNSKHPNTVHNRNSTNFTNNLRLVASGDFDLTTRHFRAAGDMGVAQTGHSATSLANEGLPGDRGKNAGGPLNCAAIFAPPDGTFRVVTAMTSARGGHSAAAPVGDRVFIASDDLEQRRRIS